MKSSTNEGPAGAQDGVRWRKSSFSPDSQCVEVAELPEDVVAVRNSNHREAGTLHFTRAEFGAWLKGCKAGEFDDVM
jgi:hypothetical protein